MEILEGKSYFDIPVHNNLRELFKTAVASFSQRIACAWRPVLSDKVPTQVTYAEMNDDFEALQAALYDPAIENRRIAIVGVNSYYWALSYYATVSGMGIAVPLDPLLTAVELVNLLKRGEVDTLICDARFIGILSPYFEELPLLKHKICMLKGRESGKKAEKTADLGEKHGFVDITDMIATGKQQIASGKTYTAPAIYPDTTAVLLFTSGTTSESKGVLLSHYNITSNVAGIARIIKVPDTFRFLSILPLHHCLENTCGLHTILTLGGQVCYCDGLRYINQNLLEYKPHVLIGVPALYDSFYKKILIAVKKQKKENAFKKARKFSKFLRSIGLDLRRKIFKSILNQFGGCLSFCISGAAHQRIEITKFLDEIGINLIQGYGLTECAPVVAGGNTQVNPHGTCGYPIGGLTIAIDNEAPGEDGEILVKIGDYPNTLPGWKNECPKHAVPGDTHITMQGYYHNEEANATVFEKEGWLRTMDIGHFDPVSKGLVLTGRAKSMIVLNNGKKVFPEEIESKLNGVDLIADSLVWAEPIHNDLSLMARLVLDDEYLEIFKKECHEKGLSEAETELALEKVLTEEVERINGEMIKFKRIRHFYFSVEDMIRTTTRKIKRKPEIDYLHTFFRDVCHREGLDLDIKNLDTINFVAYSDKTAEAAD